MQYTSKKSERKTYEKDYRMYVFGAVHRNGVWARSICI